MVLGYSTNAYVKTSVTDALHRIAAIGFKGVEIMCDRPHLYPPDFDATAMAGIREILDTRGLTVTNLNSFTLFAVGDTYLPSWIEPERERREIRIGSRRPGEVEVLEGLEAGEKVVTHGTLKVRPGQQVSIQAVDEGKGTLVEMLGVQGAAAQ